MTKQAMSQAATEVGLHSVPQHVAIIMDGNGRWAKKQGWLRSRGHRAGVETLREIIRFSDELGIEVLSFYAFSTENWSRPAEEVSTLMELLVEFLSRETPELHRNNVRICFMGDIEALPLRQRQAVDASVQLTAHNTGLVTNVALNYGGRAEIVRAARLLAQQVQRGDLQVEDIDEGLFASHLYTAQLPDPDLLIRTSGEMRLSNFMLYQCSYSEFFFPQEFWPDFDRQAYLRVLKAFQDRSRRFGGI